MHAKLVVPVYLMLFQTLCLQKRPKFGPTKIPSFNLAWLSLGNFFQKNSNPFERCLAIAFIKFFINPSLICNRGIKLNRDLLKECVEYFSFLVHINFLSAILLFHNAVQWHDCPTNIKNNSV